MNAYLLHYPCMDMFQQLESISEKDALMQLSVACLVAIGNTRPGLSACCFALVVCAFTPEGALNLCMYADSTCRMALAQNSLYGKCYVSAIIYLALVAQ